MVEKYTVIDKRPLSFTGYFKPDDLFRVVRRFLKERGYFPLETKNYEEVYEQGRQVTIELKPFKQVSDYLKQELVLVIKMSKLQDKLVEIDGARQQYMHGKVDIVFDAMIVTDLKAKWEGAGWLYFLRTINDKFIRKDWINKSKDEVGKDANDLMEEIRSYLNMIRFKIEQPAS